MLRYPEIMFQGDLEEDMEDEQGETSNQGSVKVGSQSILYYS